MAGTDGTEDEAAQTDPAPGEARPRLAPRVLLTWLELTVFGITGGVVGGSVGGPPGFVVYLATTLVSVALIFYNVDRHIEGWLAVGGAGP